MLCRKTEQASPTKWPEHLVNVPAKEFLAPNCNLYTESYIYPFQLTVILKCNQSHPTKSSKTLSDCFYANYSR